MPYADPEKQKAAMRAYYNARRAASKRFCREETERRRVWANGKGAEKERARLRRRWKKLNPDKDFQRFNLDDSADARRYLDFIASLKSAGIPYAERGKGVWRTIALKLRDLRKSRVTA